MSQRAPSWVPLLAIGIPVLILAFNLVSCGLANR